MAVRSPFWSSSRREYVSKTLSGVVLLLIGALGTTELFKLPTGKKVLLLSVAGALFVIGTFFCPSSGDKDKKERD